MAIIHVYSHTWLSYMTCVLSLTAKLDSRKRFILFYEYVHFLKFEITSLVKYAHGSVNKVTMELILIYYFLVSLGRLTG